MEPVESKELVLGRDFFIRVSVEDLIVGKDYYIEEPLHNHRILKFIGRIINKYDIEDEDSDKFIVLKDIYGKYYDSDTRISIDFDIAYNWKFYEVKKPDIINNFEKKAYEDVLSNKLTREDTRTGQRVHESLDRAALESVKMFGGKKKQRKSKRRKSYRRRKSRKCKR
jgi:hypothetical protein